MNTLSSFIPLIIILLITVGFGFWLSRAGRPYHSLLFNIHKLLALVAVILTVVQLVKFFKSVELSPLAMALMALAALSAVALFISGALMSAGKLEHALLHTIHQLAVGSLVIAIPVLVVVLR